MCAKVKNSSTTRYRAIITCKPIPEVGQVSKTVQQGWIRHWISLALSNSTAKFDETLTKHQKRIQRKEGLQERGRRTLDRGTEPEDKGETEGGKV